MCFHCEKLAVKNMPTELFSGNLCQSRTCCTIDLLSIDIRGFLFSLSMRFMSFHSLSGRGTHVCWCILWRIFLDFPLRITLFSTFCLRVCSPIVVRRAMIYQPWFFLLALLPFIVHSVYVFVVRVVRDLHGPPVHCSLITTVFSIYSYLVS